MKNTTLYRPVGLKEMELISTSNYSQFHPRLNWQPIFYPVMNQQYAEQIAKEWNTVDEFSGHCGIVTAFDVDENYLSQFEIQNVGDKTHNEFWIPSDEMKTFNDSIIGEIRIVNAFFGEKYKPSKLQELQSRLIEFNK